MSKYVVNRETYSRHTVTDTETGQTITQWDRVTIGQSATEWDVAEILAYGEVRLHRRGSAKPVYRQEAMWRLTKLPEAASHETREQRREVAIATAKAENEVEAYRIEPGYEEQALPLTARQTAVLKALHAQLGMTVPFDVLPPVEGNSKITASAEWDGGQRFLVEVDREGFVYRLAARIKIAGHAEWTELTRGDGTTYFYDRVMLVARAARLATPVNSEGSNAVE